MAVPYGSDCHPVGGRLIRTASADRAGRHKSGDIEALLSVAADQNQAALDRLAK